MHIVSPRRFVTVATLLCSLCFIVPIFAQSENLKFTISPVLQWDRMELAATVKLDLSSAGLELPTGRAHGEELLDIEFPRILSPYLFSIPIDSSTILETMIQQGQLSPLDLDLLLGKAAKSPAVLDLVNNSLNRNRTISLTGLSALLIRHQKAASLPRPLTPQISKNYTGIVIFAQDALPIYGRQGTSLLIPCLFPKIWDSEGTLVYERNMVIPEIAKTRGIVRYSTADKVIQSTPSGIDPALQDLIGERPLRILADKVFGTMPTDPVISKDDALVLLSSDNNRRLLAEGRVVIIIDSSLITQNMRSGAPSAP